MKLFCSEILKVNLLFIIHDVKGIMALLNS